jgi:hypothetical protein
MRMGYSIDEADALGDYRIDDLPAGAFVVLNVQDAASIASVRQAMVAAGATTTIDMPERTSGSGWSGRVLDHDGHPLAALDITLQPAGVRGGTGWSTKRSDTDGKFAFDGLKSGSYDVYVGGDMGRRFVRQDTIELPIAGQLAHDIRLDAGAIRGRVVRAQDGTPYGECFLLVETRTATGFVFAGIDATEPDGSFALERLRAGAWRVTAFPSARGIAQATSRDLVIAPDALELTCELSLPRGATLRVAVRDAAGLGVPGSAVEFVNERGETVQLTASDVTGPDGVLDVPGVAAGRWKLRAQRGAQSSSPVVIDLLPGDEREVALTFAP